MLDLDDHTDQLMALAAFRYCLQRRSYIVGACHDWVRNTWGEFTLSTRNVMIRDLAEGLERGTVGDDLSALSWRELLDWMRNHPQTRGE